MRYNATMISLALVIAAAPSLAMPFPAGETEARAETLEARLSVGPLLKELGKGGAVGGAFTALTEFLDHSNQQQQRDLDARAGLGSIAGIAGEDLLKELGKGAAVGGAFSALADVLNKQSKPSKRSDDLEARQVAGKVVEDGLKDLLGKNVANGIGSALGATAVGGAIEHFFGHKNSRDLSDSDLLHILSELHASGPDLVARTPLSFGDVGKAILGSGISFGAASAAQPLVNKIEHIFRRGQGDLASRDAIDDIINESKESLGQVQTRQVAGKVVEDGLKDLLGKNVANGIGSALGATAVGGAIEHFFGHKNSRDLDFDHFENFFNHDLPVKRDIVQNILEKLFPNFE